jgi:DNA polymerase IV
VKSSILSLFHAAWDGRLPIRLVGVHAGSLDSREGQMNLLEEARTQKRRDMFKAVDFIRDRFGGHSISLARTMNTDLRERVHENPYDLPGKQKE